MTKKIRVFETFSGYGSQSIALRNLGIEHEVVAISEIDKYALQGYYSLHDENILNLGDITKINIEDIPQHDLFTYSFPCQDISVAGKTKGIVKGETRSGLLYECEKIIEHCKPKYLLMENVKNLVGKKFKSQFDEWLAYLETLGYTNYWQVLNAKDYGVPQNRERVFVVSILGEHKPYEFPKPIKCNHITDFLDLDKNQHLLFDELKKNKILNTNYKTEKYITDTEKIVKGEFKEFKIMDYRYDEGLRTRKNNLCPTLTTKCGGSTNGLSGGPIIYKDGKLRGLTPKECFRLMGLKDSDIDKIQATGLNNAQQYKMAGNSIVVQVLEGIFKNLFIGEKNKNE